MCFNWLFLALLCYAGGASLLLTGEGRCPGPPPLLIPEGWAPVLTAGQGCMGFQLRARFPLSWWWVVPPSRDGSPAPHLACSDETGRSWEVRASLQPVRRTPRCPLALGGHVWASLQFPAVVGRGRAFACKGGSVALSWPSDEKDAIRWASPAPTGVPGLLADSAPSPDGPAHFVPWARDSGWTAFFSPPFRAFCLYNFQGL